MFEIENVDIMTVGRVKTPRKVRSPVSKALRALEVGQSFFAPDSIGKTNGYFYGMITIATKATSHKFSCRRVEGGYRIGRVA